MRQYMISMHDILIQKIIHYHELKNLKIVDDFDSQTHMQNFIRKYNNVRNVQNVKINNFITIVESNVLFDKNDNKNIVKYDFDNDIKKFDQSYI